jgi:hypothetical protein
MRFWSFVFFLATASLVFNSLFDEQHALWLRVLGLIGAALTLIVAVALWLAANARSARRGA